MKDIIDDWGERWTRPLGDTNSRRSSSSTEQHQQVPDTYVDDFDTAADTLVAVYDTPPFDISRRAYLELSLIIAEIVLGEGSARISAGRIYSSLSDHARVEVDPSKDGIGITNVGNAPSVFTTKREMYSETLYSVGQGLRQAYAAIQCHFPDAERANPLSWPWRDSLRNEQRNKRKGCDTAPRRRVSLRFWAGGP